MRKQWKHLKQQWQSGICIWTTNVKTNVIFTLNNFTRNRFTKNTFTVSKCDKKHSLINHKHKSLDIRFSRLNTHTGYWNQDGVRSAAAQCQWKSFYAARRGKLFRAVQLYGVRNAFLRNQRHTTNTGVYTRTTKKWKKLKMKNNTIKPKRPKCTITLNGCCFTFTSYSL